MEVIFNEIKIKGKHRNIDDKSLLDFILYLRDALTGLDEMEYYVPDYGYKESLFDVVVITHEQLYLFSLSAEKRTFWKVNNVDISAIKEEATDKEVTFSICFGSGNTISLRDSMDNLDVTREFVNTILDLSRLGLGIEKETPPTPIPTPPPTYQEEFQPQRYIQQ